MFGAYATRLPQKPRVRPPAERPAAAPPRRSSLHSAASASASSAASSRRSSLTPSTHTATPPQQPLHAHPAELTEEALQENAKLEKIRESETARANVRERNKQIQQEHRMQEEYLAKQRRQAEDRRRREESDIRLMIYSEQEKQSLLRGTITQQDAQISQLLRQVDVLKERNEADKSGMAVEVRKWERRQKNARETLNARKTELDEVNSKISRLVNLKSLQRVSLSANFLRRDMKPDFAVDAAEVFSRAVKSSSIAVAARRSASRDDDDDSATGGSSHGLGASRSRSPGATSGGRGSRSTSPTPARIGGNSSLHHDELPEDLQAALDGVLREAGAKAERRREVTTRPVRAELEEAYRELAIAEGRLVVDEFDDTLDDEDGLFTAGLLRPEETAGSAATATNSPDHTATTAADDDVEGERSSQSSVFSAHDGDGHPSQHDATAPEANGAGGSTGGSTCSRAAADDSDGAHAVPPDVAGDEERQEALGGGAEDDEEGYVE